MKQGEEEEEIKYLKIKKNNVHSFKLLFFVVVVVDVGSIQKTK